MKSYELIKMFQSLLQWKNNVLQTLLLDDVNGLKETTNNQLRKERKEMQERKKEKETLKEGNMVERVKMKRGEGKMEMEEDMDRVLVMGREEEAVANALGWWLRDECCQLRVLSLASNSIGSSFCRTMLSPPPPPPSPSPSSSSSSSSTSSSSTRNGHSLLF